MEDLAQPRTAMIDGQIKPNRVTDARLLGVLGGIPREIFVPKALRGVAYVDEDIEVAPGRYLVEPMVFARLLDAAAVKPDDLVLDVACATGYSTAVLAQLAGAVVAVEGDEALAQAASSALAALELGNANVVIAAPESGHAKDAPYDVIFVNAAMEQIPAALISQLAEGGRLVGVLREGRVGRGIVGRKTAGAFGYQAFMDANIPVLPAFSRPPAFQF